MPERKIGENKSKIDLAIPSENHATALAASTTTSCIDSHLVHFGIVPVIIGT